MARVWVLSVSTPSDHWLVGVYTDERALLSAAERYREIECQYGATATDQAWFWKCLAARDLELDGLPRSATDHYMLAGRPIVWEGTRAQSIGKAT